MRPRAKRARGSRGAFAPRGDEGAARPSLARPVPVRWGRGAPFAFGAVWLVVACGSSTGDGPKATPGQCVLSRGIWSCGTGYGDWPACPGDVVHGAMPGQPCDYDGGTCFECYEEA